MLINLSVNILGKEYPLDTKEINLIGRLNDDNIDEVFTQLQQLTSLTYLDCSYNKLTSLPNSIAHAPNGGVSPPVQGTGLGQLASLTYLHCYENKLTSLPESINDIPNLTDLRTDPNIIRPKKVLKIPDERVIIKEYFCQICLSDSPKECESVGVLLPCHHTICLDGMQEWFNKNKSLKCNYCQTLYGPSQCKHIILST